MAFGRATTADEVLAGIDLHGKVAIVTGASSGLGGEIVRVLRAHGADVVAAVRDPSRDEDTVSAVELDLASLESVRSAAERLTARLPRIDLLFNNAGISTRNIPVDDLTYEQWSNVVAVNLTGSFLCAQHAFRMMKNQTPRGGRIINNGSVSAHVPRRNSTPYSTTKHALTGLTRSLSLDGREFDIACGQIDIGNAATTRNEDTARGRLQASDRVEAEARIDVNDVARGVAYMASLSLEANVQFMTVMATKMPYIGRG